MNVFTSTAPAKTLYQNKIAGAQHQRPPAAFATKTHRAIKHDIA
jgi:hypothetical protein